MFQNLETGTTYNITFNEEAHQAKAVLQAGTKKLSAQNADATITAESTELPIKVTTSNLQQGSHLIYITLLPAKSEHPIPTPTGSFRAGITTSGTTLTATQLAQDVFAPRMSV